MLFYFFKLLETHVPLTFWQKMTSIQMQKAVIKKQAGR